MTQKLVPNNSGGAPGWRTCSTIAQPDGDASPCMAGTRSVICMKVSKSKSCAGPGCAQAKPWWETLG